MSISKKVSVLTLAASLSLVASPIASNVAMAEGNPGGLSDESFIFGMAFTSTTVMFIAFGGRRDEQAAQTLLDQAYAGAGEKLENLAGASGKSVEVVADTIIRLEKDGVISADQPEAMAEAVAVELNK